MRIYEYGMEHPETLLMFQCACEPTWIFDEPARQLSHRYHVFLAGADGHDPSENTTFTTVEDYAGKTVNALKKKGIDHLDYLYGVSMGGAAAMHLLAWNLIPVRKAIIDAGITPYPYPLWLRRLISYRDFCLIPLATINMDVLKKVSPPEAWTPEGKDPVEHYERIYDFLKHHYSRETNYNVFWSANNYQMPDPMPSVNTEMEYWYGSEEKKDRKNDLIYVKKNFPQCRIVEQEGYGHAQLVIVHPHAFAMKAMNFFDETE